MKKFLTTKINKEQWRLTVPNINSAIFRKSPAKDDDKSDKESKRSSGFYDFQEAQNEYDKSRSLPNSVYVDTSSESEEEDGEEIFEDARAMSDRTKDASDTDVDVYTDVEPIPQAEPTNIDKNNSRYEYDVPRISFKFFEKQQKENDVNNDETEEKIEHEYEDAELPHYEPVKVVRSELKLSLLPAKSDEEEFEEVIPEESNLNTPVCHPSEKFVSHTEVYLNSLECIPMATIKSAGSDPNIALRQNSEQDDGFYQVPRSLKKAHRLSQSLNDFDIDKVEDAAPRIESVDDSSVEHISASQVIVCSNLDNATDKDSIDESKVDKKTSKKSGIPMRRPSFLKTPKKTVEKWNNFKSKFNNIMMEQAAQQRVGAYEDKERIAINIEEMYKNSKTKCKKIFQNTSKMFQKKKHLEYFDDNSSESASKAHLKASDIEYKLNYEISDSSEQTSTKMCDESRTSEENSVATDGKVLSSNVRKPSVDMSKVSSDSKVSCDNASLDDSKKEDFDFSALKTALRKKLFTNEGQNGFEDLRRYVKQGGDFCKELAVILQERAEAESQYAKSLSKLSSKLLRSCREGIGGINEAWKAVAIELETRAEAHRLMGISLLEETAKPLKSLSESQHRIRKQSEVAVDKSARLLSDWRTTEAKGKKNSHTCARENEKLQDAAVLDNTKFGKQTISKSNSLIHLANIHSKQNNPDKENAKLEGKKRKAEDAVKKADVEYYSLCVRAERARLEWESAVLRGASTFQALEEERLGNLKTVLTSYLHHSNDLGPRLIEATERLKSPLSQAEPTKDLITFQNLRQSSQQVAEQLLPDFYCEHITLAMNRERRKQALIKLLHLIRDDIERERKSKTGLENLSKAMKQTPSFGSEDSQQTVSEKLYHMKSMLTYLEASRYKVQNALAELDSRPRSGHALAPYITVTRDKSGLQQSVLKVPQWLRDEWCDSDKSPISEKSLKSDKSDNSDPHINDVEDQDWLDRGAADGNSNQPDSDFDEFSSQCSSSAAGNLDTNEENPVKLLATCRAIYAYTPNMHDELQLRPGDILSVYRQQDDGWWLGECSGNVGIFPATYVEIISKTDNVGSIQC